MVTLKTLKRDEEVQTLIKTGEKQLDAMAYTEHSVRHASIVATWTGEILKEIGMEEHIVNLGEIAGYLHDIGNSLSRHEHALTGGVMAYQILKRLGLPLEDCAEVMMAIGNHDEMHGIPVSVLSAALIIADKSDVHKSRVKDKMLNESTNIHDRVNLAVNRSYVSVNNEDKKIDTVIETDPLICTVADYFNIYDNRMQMCSKAAELLGYKYGLVINGVRML